MSNVYIKNMVCNRCILVVEEILKKEKIAYTTIRLGEVEMDNELTLPQRESLRESLSAVGFELMDDKRSVTIEQIKSLLIALIYEDKLDLNINISDYLSDKLQHDYSYLSNLFSEVEGKSIEKFFIAQKIERVKELIVYNELTLSEIANLLRYSSVAHLSNQFKKVTGLTPSYFKQIKSDKRKPIDQI
ncbi:helix-turn-helix domain-containing protein [Sphingobacterium hungaricum]|uniref:AraC family transcriptional regulator n=1 Tax=Sphingobacterium hungaricum TaxID=2082723 RepID=A0A928YRZ8_9SPHI|nr:AraC family transcriptional regulator [Sphingobacterium hungaricum]MBE8714705.1 AraC family transcriptional regulator [Sphingobacterium hungaricum]